MRITSSALFSLRRVAGAHGTIKAAPTRYISTQVSRKPRQFAARSVAAVACSSTFVTLATPVLCEGDSVDGEDSAGAGWILGIAAALAGGALYFALQPDGEGNISPEATKQAKGTAKTGQSVDSALQQGNLVKAEKLLIELLKTQHEKGDPAETETLCKLATVRFRSGRAFDALDAMERSASLKNGAESSNTEELVKNEREAVLWVLTQLGTGGAVQHAARTYLKSAQDREKKGKIVDAVVAYGRALTAANFCQKAGMNASTTASKEKDPLDPEVLMNNIGRLLHKPPGKGDTKESRAMLFTTGVKAMGVGNGWKHKVTALVLRDSANAQYAAGNADAALEALEQAFAIQEDVLSPTDLQLGQTLVLLGDFCLEVRDDSRRATKCYEQASTIFTLELGNAHPRTEQTKRRLKKAQDRRWS